MIILGCLMAKRSVCFWYLQQGRMDNVYGQSKTRGSSLDIIEKKRIDTFLQLHVESNIFLLHTHTGSRYLISPYHR